MTFLALDRKNSGVTIRIPSSSLIGLKNDINRWLAKKVITTYKKPLTNELIELQVYEKSKDSNGDLIVMVPWQQFIFNSLPPYIKFRCDEIVPPSSQFLSSSDRTISTNILLREAQKNLYDLVEKERLSTYILNLPTGFGKTVLGIYILFHLYGPRINNALILAPKRDLLNQWKEQILNALPLENNKITLVSLDSKEWKDLKPSENGLTIYLATVQGFSKQIQENFADYKCVMDSNPSLFQVIFLDELHLFPTNYFQTIFFNLYPLVAAVGFTATINRTDERDNLFRFFFEKTYSLEKHLSKKKQQSLVYKLDYNSPSKLKDEFTFVDGRQVYCIAKMVNQLASDDARTTLAIQYFIRSIYNKENSNVLILSDRKSQVEAIYTVLANELAEDEIYKIIGTTKSHEISKAKQNARIIVATYSMVDTGFDVPRLNTLIFATPKVSIQQAIGRIYRQKHQDFQPVIIDIVDSSSQLFINQAYKRMNIIRQQVDVLRVFNVNLLER